MRLIDCIKKLFIWRKSSSVISAETIKLTEAKPRHLEKKNMATNSFHIDISSPTQAFEAHLALEGNGRILFSGIFGIGKTYFLKRFFGERKAEYVAVRLRPVNYSVASNEDIFRFLKYDMLADLMVTHDWMPEKFDESYYDADFYRSFAIVQGSGLVKELIKLLPIVGKSLVGFSEKLSQLEKTFQDEQERLRTDEAFCTFEAFWSEVQESYLYENGPIDALIRGALNELASQPTEAIGSEPIKDADDDSIVREKILIIDDLDRLDSEHIFRLFNVFSAHFDEEQENQWGFDRVIFVADIDNIRSIFHAGYGLDTDFSGYVDKFYSREVFRFDNVEGIKKSILEVFKEVEFIGWASRNYEKQRFLKRKIIPILVPMVYAGAINLRSLLNLSGKMEFANQEFRLPAVSPGFSNRQFEGMIVLEFLNRMFGNTASLKAAIDKTDRFLRNHGVIGEQYLYKDLTASLLLLLGYRAHSFRIESTTDQIEYSYSHQDPISNDRTIDFVYLFAYEPRRDPSTYEPKILAAKADFVDNSYDLEQNVDTWTEFYFFQILSESVGLLVNWKILK